MIKQTAIANSIEATDLDAPYDSACKKLLSNKQILAWILKSTVKEYKTCDIHDIAEKYIEGTPEVSKVLVQAGETNANITGMNNEDNVFKEGTITYDIRFQAVYPKSGEHIKLFINVEAQNDFHPGYSIPKRGIFYCSRMLSAQYSTEFEAPHYDDIRKVYSIWICMNPSKRAGNTITQYQMGKADIVGTTEDKPMDYDLLSVITICLGGENLAHYGGILKLLDVLLSATKTSEMKKDILEREYAIAMTTELEKEVDVMCNLSQGVLAIGEEIGEVKGEVKAGIITIKKLLNKGKSAEQIVDLLDMDISYVKHVEELLKTYPDKSEAELAKLL